MDLRNNILIRQIYFRLRNFLEKRSYSFGKNNIKSFKGVNVNNRIHVHGSNNKIETHTGSVVKNCLIHMQGNNNSIIIKEKACVSGAELWLEGNGCIIEIGENTFVGHHSHLACTEEECKLILGNDCMLSSYVQVRTGDSHSILNLNKERLNKAESVYIGDHCWLGEGCKILKGVKLDKDIVVSTGAIVTESFKKNVLLGGIPAKIIKEEITWDSKRL